MKERKRRFPIFDCSVLVVGLGVSGKSTLRYLREIANERRLEVYVADQAETEQTRKFLDELAFPHLHTHFSPDAVEALVETRKYTKFDLCIISPGIPCWEDLYCQAYAYSKELISEVEFAWRESDVTSRWVAITGTNGKTTTTSLCAAMLQNAGYKAAAVGNIGDACIEAVGKHETDIYVAEVSSYQLASSLKFAPNVVVMLNITPDHIHWHETYDKYKEAKFHLLRNIARYRDTTVIFDVTNDVERAQAWAQLVKYTRMALENRGAFQADGAGAQTGADGAGAGTQECGSASNGANALASSGIQESDTAFNWDCNECGDLEDPQVIEPPEYNALPHFVWVGSKAGLRESAQTAYKLEKIALIKASDPARTLLQDVKEHAHDAFDPCLERVNVRDLLAFPLPDVDNDLAMPQLSCAFVNEHNELCETQAFTYQQALHAGFSACDEASICDDDASATAPTASDVAADASTTSATTTAPVPSDTSVVRFGSVDDLHIKGEHNVNNALCATAAAFAITHSADTFPSSYAAFLPLEHRIEPCGTVADVAFYNDSKGTNVDSTLKAITSFPHKNLIVLLGGEDKGTTIEPLVACAHQYARMVILYGEARRRFDEAFSAKESEAPENFQMFGASHMRDAFNLACLLAHKGDVILLSPACASFDEFKSFEHRGTVFKQLVTQRRSELGE